MAYPKSKKAQEQILLGFNISLAMGCFI